MQMCVLLVDGEERQRLRSSATLLQAGCEIVAVPSVADAMGAVGRAGSRMHLVLGSAALAEGGALQLVREVARCNPRLPVAVSAGVGEREVALACISAGALAMVQNPIEGDEIKAWLLSLARRAASGLSAERNAGAAVDNAELMRRMASSGRLASLGQLAASISHEIKNPLNYVLENARYVEQKLHVLHGEPALVAQVRDAVRDVVSGAERIGDLVRDVGTMASPDETTMLTFDLCDAVRAAMRMASVELRGRAQVLTRLGSGTLVLGSIGRMTQVFVNLIVNAAQAIGREEANRGRIVVVCRRNGGRVLAEVSDDGPGIAPGLASRLFEAFFTTKRAGEGTGLGLFLSRDIVRRHGGELRVRSVPGRGTTFAIDLPVDPQLATAHEGARVGPAGLSVRADSKDIVAA